MNNWKATAGNHGLHFTRYCVVLLGFIYMWLTHPGTVPKMEISGFQNSQLAVKWHQRGPLKEDPAPAGPRVTVREGAKVMRRTHGNSNAWVFQTGTSVCGRERRRRQDRVLSRSSSSCSYYPERDRGIPQIDDMIQDRWSRAD